ncbi:hypothetical protein GC163_10575 [bacterium]|nr:hypothetical protein [bacterium]
MPQQEPRRWLFWYGWVVLPAVLSVLLLGASVAKAARIKTPMPFVHSMNENAAQSAICRGGENPAMKAAIAD